MEHFSQDNFDRALPLSRNGRGEAQDSVSSSTRPYEQQQHSFQGEGSSPSPSSSSSSILNLETQLSHFSFPPPYNSPQPLHHSDQHPHPRTTYPLDTYNLSTPPQTPSPARRLFAQSTPRSLLQSPYTSKDTDETAWGRDDPVTALERRGTPFFMPFFSQEEGEGHTGEGESPPADEGVKLQRLAGVERHGGFGFDGAGGEVGMTRRRRREGENGRESGDGMVEVRDPRRDSGYSEANFSQLSSTVHSLTSHVSTLTDLTDSLYTRLRFLEESTYARDREIETLRSLLPPPPPQQFVPAPLPSRPFVPPPLPHDLLDYPPSPAPESTNGGDLTPPASAPAGTLRHPIPHHVGSFFPYQPQPREGSRSSTPRSNGGGRRMRAQSVAVGAFDGPPPHSHQPYHQQNGFPPPSFPPYGPQHPYQQPYHYHPPQLFPHPHGPFFHEGGRNANDDQGFRQADGQGGFRYEGGRERCMSLAAAPSSANGSGSGGSNGEGGSRTIPPHQRSLSMSVLPFHAAVAVSSPYTSRRPSVVPSGPNGATEQINYRLLLDTDCEIDDEAFVRRILVHNDQQCSLFLQQRVRSTTEDKKQHLFEAVGKHVLELSQSKFGNFLVSRCLEAGDQSLAHKYEKVFSKHLLALALDPFGCHVVQELLDCGDGAMKGRIIDELITSPSSLLQKNACHVWNRILTTSNPPSFYRRLAEMGKGTWADVVKDEGGSLIVQHVLEDWGEAHTSTVAREVLAKIEEVVETACGTFVLGHLIDRNALPFCSKVMQLATKLATENSSAKLVDKVIRSGRASPAAVSSFVESLVTSQPSDASPPLLLHVARSPNGAQLLAVLLLGPASSHKDKEKLSRCITAHKVELTSDANGHAARLVAMCGQGRVNGK